MADFPDVEAVAAKIVDLGNVLTAGGVTSGIDLALHLLERFLLARKRGAAGGAAAGWTVDVTLG